jgi:hypothetical protein
MFLRTLTICFLLACSHLYGQVNAPATIPAGQLVPIEVEGNPKSCVVLVRAIGNEKVIPTFEVVAPTKTYVFTALGPQYYIIDVITSDETGKQEHFFTKTFIQGEGDIDPTPNPPDPNPDPRPEPNPGPAPIPLAGFRVLFISESEDSSDFTAMPKEQREIFYSPLIRDYLNAKCVKGPDGKTADWRVIDPDAEFSPEEQRWKDAASRSRQEIPWLIISDGKTGFEGPLPDNVDDTLKLLKKFGGE